MIENKCVTLDKTNQWLWLGQSEFRQVCNMTTAAMLLDGASLDAHKALYSEGHDMYVYCQLREKKGAVERMHTGVWGKTCQIRLWNHGYFGDLPHWGPWFDVVSFFKN